MSQLVHSLNWRPYLWCGVPDTAYYNHIIIISVLSILNEKLLHVWMKISHTSMSIPDVAGFCPNGIPAATGVAVELAGAANKWDDIIHF